MGRHQSQWSAIIFSLINHCRLIASGKAGPRHLSNLADFCNFVSPFPSNVCVDFGRYLWRAAISLCLQVSISYLHGRTNWTSCRFSVWVILSISELSDYFMVCGRAEWKALFAGCSTDGLLMVNDTQTLTNFTRHTVACLCHKMCMYLHFITYLMLLYG